MCVCVQGSPIVLGIDKQDRKGEGSETRREKPIEYSCPQYRETYSQYICSHDKACVGGNKIINVYPFSLVAVIGVMVVYSVNESKCRLSGVGSNHMCMRTLGKS